MAQAQQGSTVQVHYTGRLTDGQVFDSSEGRAPLEFVLGAGQMIPGFEAAVEGMEPGESTTATLSADDAYGPRRDDMVLTVPREQLPPDLDPETGDQLQLQQEGGPAIPVVVTDVDDASITIDANHPLAGQTLVFDIQLVSVD